MKKARYRPSHTNSRVVKVQLAVTNFRDVFSEKSAVTDYQMSLSRESKRVRLEKDTLYIKPPGVTLQFTLTSTREDRERYYPLGISYVRDGESKSDELRLGFVNFPQKKQGLKCHTITITDSYRDRQKYVRYKFSIFVQRGSDGKIGIIDPSMIHDNGEPH